MNEVDIEMCKEYKVKQNCCGKIHFVIIVIHYMTNSIYFTNKIV